MKWSWRFGAFVVAGVVVMTGTLVMATESAFGANGPNVPTARWQAAIASLPLPGKGCFAAVYPALTWHVTHCKVAPEVPFADRQEGILRRLATPPAAKPVGNGNDYSAVVTGPITEATGSFANVSPGISERGQYDGSGPKLAQHFLSPAQHTVLQWPRRRAQEVATPANVEGGSSSSTTRARTRCSCNIG